MAKTNKKVNTVAETSAPTPAAQVSTESSTSTTLEPVQLTIADLQLLSRIVDLASRRGAFQAGELSQVGDAFNKLTGFLTYVENMQKKEEAEKAEAVTQA